MKLINDDMQLKMVDEKGNVVKSILHFGAYKELRDKLFGGQKMVEIDENDFDEIAEDYCSPYGKGEK